MPDVNEQLLAAGLKRVVQCARGAERDAFGGPLRTTWLDTDWPSIEAAQFHHPEYLYRNAVIGGEDEQFEEEKVEAVGSPEEPESLTYTRNDIKNMSAVEYRHKLVTVRGFKAYVDELVKDDIIQYVGDNNPEQIAEALEASTKRGEENAKKLNDARRLNEKFRDDLEEAGIPIRAFRSMEDCGCGLGPECTIKR